MRGPGVESVLKQRDSEKVIVRQTTGGAEKNASVQPPSNVYINCARSGENATVRTAGDGVATKGSNLQGRDSIGKKCCMQ